MAEEPLVPLFDLELEEEAVEAVAATLRSGWLTMGPQCQSFEEAFGAHLGTSHAIALSSCTAALHLAYLSAGVGPGDEVIVPAITFVASAAAVRYCGATPVLADVLGEHDLGIDPDDVERKLTERTRAVCVVHYGGYAAPVERVEELCEQRGLALIEDAAHSPLATDPRGRQLGTIGLAGAFSFFSNKVFSCGEGGLLATDDDRVAALARRLRSHAMTSTTWDRHRGHAAGYDVVDVGYNYRLDEPRAALLNARLPTLADQVARRREVVRRYRELLADVPNVTVPYTDEEVDRSSCYVMPVIVPPAERPRLQQRLLERWRVQTSVLYPSIAEFTAYQGFDNAGLERSQRVASSELTIPLYPHLSERDQQRVVDALRAELAELAA